MLFDWLVSFIIIICIIISVVRGFIKELCALMLLFFSIFLTVDHYDFFTSNYSKYFNSKSIQDVFSAISVFVMLNLVFMLANNIIMYILLPIRLGLIDRVTGVLIGTLRGVFLSYALFFTIYLYCCVASDNRKEESPKIEIEEEYILPYWIINSYSYQALFSRMGSIIDIYIPESVILKIKRIAQGTIDEEED